MQGRTKLQIIRSSVWIAPTDARLSVGGLSGPLLCILILSFSACHHARENEIALGAQNVFALAKDIEKELTKDIDSKRDFQELLPAYRQKLKPLLKGNWERECNSKCMTVLFQATDYVCFFSFGQTSDPELPDVLRTTFNHLKASGLSSEDQAREARKCLIKFRRFDEARKFSRTEQLSGEEIPSLEVPASLSPIRRVIKYAPDGRSVSVAQAKPLGKKAVLMIASPTCGASNEALKAIESDAAFRKALLPKLTIIAPPSGIIEAAAFSGWNRQHPLFPQAQAFGSQDWPEAIDWGTPGFYFVLEGKVVAYKWGWGPGALEGIRSELRKLDAIGTE